MGRSLIIGVAALALFAGPAGAQTPSEKLSEASAQAIIDGCRAHAREKGYGLVIAVYDEGANLKAFSRMDAGRLRNADIAQWKAAYAARSGRSSQGAARAVAEGQLNGAFAPGTATYQGAVPIYSKTGVLLGGVGVSGATGAQDEECAVAGLKAADLLAAPAE